MESLILLGIENLELDWGKQHIWRNHSKLFCESDIKPASYYYFDDQNDSYRIENKPAYVRKLGGLIRRLELLGYTLSECCEQYTEQTHSAADYCKPLSFEAFRNMIASINVARVVVPDEPSNYDPGEFAAKVIFQDREFLRRNRIFSSMDEFTGLFYEDLDPYIALRLLAENPKNLEKDIIWRFEDYQSSAPEGNAPTIYEGLSDSDRFLIVTEGSSDSAILSKSLPLVAPDVADFFYFIDMRNNYPFTGTGNVFRFCQGLARIRIQNSILVLLDNDTAGHETKQRILGLDLPPKMRVTTLPDIKEARHITTLGPTGQAVANVNGKAVSIEFFLDLPPKLKKPTVRWTSFNDSVGHYQGELIEKETYVKAFYNQQGHNKGYDLSKLRNLWSHVIETCTL
jgi:HEPN/Toprim N-terminal domain 1